MDFFLEHHATQDMTRYHSRNGLYQKDVTSPELFLCIVRLWTLENLNLASENVITLLMTLSLLASSSLKKILVLHFIHQK